jgi:hypothetical protein
VLNARGPEFRIVGRYQPLHRIHPLVQAARQLVQFVQQRLVARGQRGGGLPAGYVVKDDPG